MPQKARRGRIIEDRDVRHVEKFRFKSIEELAISEAKAEEARRRYATSEKGLAAHYRFERSEPGQAVRAKYWASLKGKLTQTLYRQQRRLYELKAWHIQDKEQATKIAEVTKNVAELLGAREVLNGLQGTPRNSSASED